MGVPRPAGATVMVPDDVRTTIGRAPANYSASAAGYAEFWSPVIRPVGQRLLDALSWGGARWILDVGTGTGALIPDLQERAPGARIVGIDPSLGMLARARDARVPLAEVRRALRRPGSLGLTTWAEEPTTPATRIWDEELDADGAQDPSPHSTQEALMNSPEKVRDLLGAAGFVAGQVWLERVAYQWTAARFMGLRTHHGATRRRLEALDPPTRRACLARIDARVSHLGSADLLCRGTAVCATAAA
jgi:SAM-dependent methyltransferase